MRHSMIIQVQIHRNRQMSSGITVKSQLVTLVMSHKTGSYIPTISKIYDHEIHGKIIALLQSTHAKKNHRNVVGNPIHVTVVINRHIPAHTIAHHQ